MEAPVPVPSYCCCTSVTSGNAPPPDGSPPEAAAWRVAACSAVVLAEDWADRGWELGGMPERVGSRAGGVLQRRGLSCTFLGRVRVGRAEWEG